MTNASPVVEVKNVSITFPGVKALDDVSFRLLPGEVHSLMGENGAGKSTLIKALTGVYQIDSGSIFVSGEERHLTGTASSQEAGISTVYQEVNLCSNLSIGENVMLGHEVHGWAGINWRKTHAQARDVLAQMGLGHLNPRAPLSSISLALQQLVAISRAMVTDSKVLILDEPTSSLDANEVSMLFSVIRRLRDQGVAILFVSHFLDQVYEISDRITVLRNGQFVGEFLASELDRTSLISKMIGKDFESLKALGSNRQTEERDRSVTPVLAAEGIGRKGAINPTDIEIHAGEVVGFAGLLGSGRTELARIIAGADKADSGTIQVKGEKVTINSPVAGLAHGIAYSTENRRDDGIVGDLSVRENIMLAVQARRGWMRRVPAKEVDQLVTTYMERFAVRPNDPDRPIRLLSGGNQQKVLLGRWLSPRSRRSGRSGRGGRRPSHGRPGAPGGSGPLPSPGVRRAPPGGVRVSLPGGGPGGRVRACTASAARATDVRWRGRRRAGTRDRIRRCAPRAPLHARTRRTWPSPHPGRAPRRDPPGRSP